MYMILHTAVLHEGWLSDYSQSFIVPLVQTDLSELQVILLWVNTCLDNSGSDLRNLIGQLQVSKRGRNLERDSKCQWGGF